MRLFRVKELVATSSGFLYKGQLFLVDGPMDLPKPNTSGDLKRLLADKYEEITGPSPFIKIDTFIKTKEIF